MVPLANTEPIRLDRSACPCGPRRALRYLPSRSGPLASSFPTFTALVTVNPYAGSIEIGQRLALPAFAAGLAGEKPGNLRFATALPKNACGCDGVKRPLDSFTSMQRCTSP